MNTINFIDHLLRNREQIISDLQDKEKSGQVIRTCFRVFVVLSIAYGLIMGSQSLMHGHWHGWICSLATGAKLPLLFLLTLAICMPLLYVMNVLLGPREHFRVIFGVLMSSLAVTSIILAACALILGFFMLSTRSYAFITLLNVAIFSIAGLYGVWFLSRAMHTIAKPIDDEYDLESNHGNNTGTIVGWWLLTYGIVGTQMAWLMRPFIGSPDQPFSIFRPQESNFYIAVIKTIIKLFTGQ